MKNIKNKIKAFTLVEVLLAMALMASIAGISAVVLQSFQVNNDLVLTQFNTAQTLRRAQALSQAVEADDTWGVNITSTELTLFKGTAYASRDNTYDEVFGISANVNISGVQEIVFSKLDGEPSTTGTITFSTNAETLQIQVNSKGTVIY